MTAKERLRALKATKDRFEGPGKRVEHVHDWKYIDSVFILGHCIAVFECECGKSKQEEL